MNEQTLANRYAEALLDVAVERDCVREMEEQLTWLGSFYEENEDLRNVVRNPLIEMEEKISIVNDAFQGHIREEMLNFLTLLVEKKRAVLIPRIAKTFDELADDYRGLVRVEAEAARDLSPERERELKNQLQRLLDGQEVELETNVNPDLMAGIRVRIGDHVLDSSLSGRLDGLQERLRTQNESL